VKPFVIRDEWYYNMRFVDDLKDVTPILTESHPITREAHRMPRRIPDARNTWPGPMIVSRVVEVLGLLGGIFTATGRMKTSAESW